MSKVVITLNGGLGNQMFQYAAARAVAERCGVPLVLDIAWYAGVEDRKYALAPFGVREQALELFEPADLSRGLFARIARRFRRMTVPNRMGLPIFREHGFAYDPRIETLTAPVWIEGYYQSSRYFSSCEATIRDVFGVPRNLSAESNEMLARIRASDAICLHVRRGDYVNNPVANAYHGLCGLDYYAAGLEKVSEGMSAPHCFVFSDDPQWVRENLKFQMPMTVVDINGPERAHEDMWLMAACRRFVIANSSFSWWAAWLGSSVDKQVVAPAQWFAGHDADTRDLIPASWSRM